MSAIWPVDRLPMSTPHNWILIDFYKRHIVKSYNGLTRLYCLRIYSLRVCCVNWAAYSLMLKVHLKLNVSTDVKFKTFSFCLIYVNI